MKIVSERVWVRVPASVLEDFIKKAFAELHEGIELVHIEEKKDGHAITEVTFCFKKASK